MESGEWRELALREVASSIGRFGAFGNTLWPDGQERLPGEEYPPAFVEWLAQGKGTLHEWPADVKSRCEKLTLALEEFPRVGVRMATVMALGSDGMKSSLWDGVLLSLGSFLSEFQHQEELTYPGADRLKGTSNPLAILQLASRWRELRGHLRALERFLLNVEAQPAMGKQPDSSRKKRSTEKGEGRKKLVAALTKHHQYSDDSCLNQEPIGNNQLARLAEVEESTASLFFKEEFGGHLKYRGYCQDRPALVWALKLMNGEVTPHEVFRGPTATDVAS